MKKIILGLCALIILGAFTTTTAWASQPVFKDVTGNHWARSGVEEVSAAGVITGHTDGTFRPNQPVTRLHTIVMLVRANNLQQQVDNYDLADFNYQFPPGISTGSKRYLAVAADEGWISPGGIQHMQPNSPASRQEVAVLLAVAFELSGNFQRLPFADKDQISSGHRNHVAGVYEAGIMRGQSASLFAPRANVKRSELAVIFARMIEQDKINPNPDQRVDGYIQDYNRNTGQIAFNKGTGRSTVYTLARNAPVYDGDRLISATALRANQPARIYLDQNNRVIFIRTTGKVSPRPAQTTTKTEYWGQIQSLSTNNLKIALLDDDSKTFLLDDDVRVYDQDNDRCSLLALSKDAFVKLELQSNKVQKIYVADIANITGAITAIRDNRITVSKSGRQQHYDVNEDLTKVVDKRGDRFDYDDLEVGSKVKITYSDKQALKIEFLDEGTGYHIGTVYRLSNDRHDENDWEISIRDIHGQRNSYDVDEDVEVYDTDGQEICFRDLDQDNRDTVILSQDRRGDVETIKLVDIYDGTIESLDDHEIELDNQVFDLPRRFDTSDYIIGSEVSVSIHDDQVYAIQIIDAEDINVPGEIRDIDERDWEITIRQDNGNRFTFDVDQRVDINDEVDNDNLDFDDLRDNWEVILELDNGAVEEIIITEK
ncbi:S-layer homology domain-containing protein [Peptococcaceae bacterium]|nr:S-layer homology domain-containing protein [Peptococcaceae bacterium]